MKVAIIGYGIENQSAVRYWLAKGAEITVCDRNESVEVPSGIKKKTGDDYLEKLDEFDIIVRTVGMHPRLILEKNPKVADKITTAVNIFFSECATPVIGVTGTKGKGTTSTLITKMLEAAGKKVVLGGNIGIPLLDLLEESKSSDYVVAELSSFQLLDLKYSPHIGVCLMVVPEHLDWHENFEEYVSAKQQMFKHQKADDIAIYYSENDNSKKIANGSIGKLIPFCERPGAVVESGALVIDGIEICKTSDLKLLGQHNWQNACAALTACWQITKEIQSFQEVLSSFKGLEHRLEFIREFDGVKYYDDSFGTTPETATVAIQAFSQPKIIILGGSQKGAQFNELANVIAECNVRQVILIGNSSLKISDLTAPQIESELRKLNFQKITSLVKPGGCSMPEIISIAKKAALPGDIVLFSTASASFDMFENYKDRGQQFITAVKSLT